MNFSRYIVLALKGCAMGMADVVPGVSGGTIAFISGIYEELLDSIRSVNATALKLLLKLRLGEFWRHINGSFLLPVLLGIAIAIFSLARLMTYLLTYHPIAIWSFFFGLIIASALLVARQIGRWDWRSLLAFVAGAAAAWWITVATPAETPNDWWFVMLSGAIAICAMILPGISGAFILLLLGKYQYIMQAVGDLNIPVIVIFVVGAAAWSARSTRSGRGRRPPRPTSTATASHSRSSSTTSLPGPSNSSPASRRSLCRRFCSASSDFWPSTASNCWRVSSSKKRRSNPCDASD